MNWEHWIDKFIAPGLLAVLLAVLGIVGKEKLQRIRSDTRVKVGEDDDRISMLDERRAEKLDFIQKEAKYLGRIELLERLLGEAEKRLTVVAMVSAANPTAPVQAVLDSGFLDLQRPLRVTPPRPPPPKPSDPFQAAQPYTPIPDRRRPDHTPLGDLKGPLKLRLLGDEENSR